MHGLGVYTWKIGDKYIGEAPLHPSHSSRAGVARACFGLHARHRTGPLQVSYGRIHGFGTYTWRTNSKYVGCWKEGKMHGHGVKTDPHGNLCASALRLRPAPPPCASALRHSTPLHGLHAPLHRLHATCPRPGPPPAPVSGLRASGGRASPSSRTRPTSRPTSWRGSTTPWVRWRVRGATRRDAPAACPGSPARPPSLCYHPLMRPTPTRAPLMADAPPPGQEYASVSQHDDD